MNKVKLFTFTSLLLFFITIAGLLTAAYIDKANKKIASTNGVLIGLFGVEKAGMSGSVGGSADTYLTLEEVAKHNSRADCWMVIDGAVYALFPFMDAHPGGAAAMTPYCGKDGSDGFISKDKKPASKHSTLAVNMLKDYFIGRLGQLIASSGSSPTPPLTLSPTIKTTTNISKPSANSALALTAAEISRHNNPGDCWVTISGRVYNLTSYLVQHPGGASAISQYCGGDGTAGFATKNTGSSHSSFAQNLLGSYLIGTAGQSVAVLPPTPTNPPIMPTTIPSNLALTSSEVARHNSLADCWITVSGQVYDVTRYIVSHPGGATAITNTCGSDATTAFQTRGGQGGNHSNTAYNLLAGYRIGALNSQVPVVPTTVPGVATNTPAPTSQNIPQSILDKYPGATRISGKYEDNGSWEGKINTSTGQCREIKVNSGGSISEDKSC